MEMVLVFEYIPTIDHYIIGRRDEGNNSHENTVDFSNSFPDLTF